jgi:hypothetical protein
LHYQSSRTVPCALHAHARTIGPDQALFFAICLTIWCAWLASSASCGLRPYDCIKAVQPPNDLTTSRSAGVSWGC